MLGRTRKTRKNPPETIRTADENAMLDEMGMLPGEA